VTADDRLLARLRSDVGRMRDVKASPVSSVLIEVAAPSDGAARAALWDYIDDVASRWYGRPATDVEIAAALLDDPSEDLAAPRGTFLVARRGETVVGCAGLRLLPDGVGKVKRVFVAPLARGHGLGRRLMLELENLARAEGLRTLRLDTPSDLSRPAPSTPPSATSRCLLSTTARTPSTGSRGTCAQRQGSVKRRTGSRTRTGTLSR